MGINIDINNYFELRKIVMNKWANRTSDFDEILIAGHKILLKNALNLLGETAVDLGISPNAETVEQHLFIQHVSELLSLKFATAKDKQGNPITLVLHHDELTNETKVLGIMMSDELMTRIDINSVELPKNG